MRKQASGWPFGMMPSITESTFTPGSLLKSKKLRDLPELFYSWKTSEKQAF